jgi:UDP-3-O-[3-hydroxymyristoyl] N-acetylglucosamine deacetylase
MTASRKQRTIASTVAVEGFGFWSGRDVRIEFRPAEPNSGIVFVRRDLAKPARIPATVEHRIEVPRRTVLTCNGGSVEMIEHVMAALAGSHVDNCEIWTNEGEMPGCDGSSLPFLAAIESAGFVEQDAVRSQIVVRSATRVGTEESWIEARPSTNGNFSLAFSLDYGDGNAIGRQSHQLVVTPESFRRELASCRTFMLQEEAEWLLARGLGTRVTPKSVLVFDQQGLRENELRFEDECVRHKLLDLVGDLALTGVDLVGHFVAHRSGHRLNAEMAQMLLNEEYSVAGQRRSA